jgi:hypothetical protein
VAVLSVFCDETGTHKGAPLTCVGGYAFDKNGQRLFAEQWAAVLEPLRDKGIGCFRASPCNTGNGPFANLTIPERHTLFEDLIRVVRCTARFGMVAGIEDQIFQEVMRRNKVQSHTGSKYTVCALRSLVLLGRWADENNCEDGIEYFFESGNESQGEADFMMKNIAASPELVTRFRYAGHWFHPKSSLPCLQAADLLLWLWQKAFAEKRFSSYFEYLRKKPNAIPHYVAHISDASLNIMAMVNMFYGVQSNRKYETQQGSVRTYTG